VRIEVWDTGIGIAPEHQRAIFQEFYQVGNPQRDRTKGLGLGLSIAARLAETGQTPDAVLCDYRLPRDETGSDVIRRLRAHTGVDLPAALITGDTAPERIREAKDSSVPLLYKPVQPARLRALLEYLLSGRTISPSTPPTAANPASARYTVLLVSASHYCAPLARYVLSD
jgi:CheY-like chemotaxis protein